MALGATGAMRMGADVNVELGSASTTQISLGQASVRTLIGVASGAVMFPTNFYGKSSGPTVGMFYGGIAANAVRNLVTRINACGALIGSETTVGTARAASAGAKVGSNGLFYGGYTGANSSRVTRINTCGTQVGACGAVGTARYGLAGATVGCNGLFFGAYHSNLVTRINACGAIVGSETTAGTGRNQSGGATVGSNGLFYAGQACCSGFVDILTNKVTRINSSGALVGSETTAGTVRRGLAGATVGSNGLFYGACNYPPGNTVTRINACGAIVGSETTAGTGKANQGGATVGSNGLFYAGGAHGIVPNTAIRINACGAIVGSETTVGTARANLAGAGL